MRTVLLSIILLMAAVPCFAGNFTLGYSLLWSPPGYDRVSGAYVDVGSATIAPGINTENFRLSYEIEAVFVTTWQPSDQRGHGFEKFTTNYAWEPEKTLLSSTLRAELGPEEVHLYLEFYRPWDRRDPDGWGRGHGRETEYYGQIGVAGRLNLWGW